MGKFDEIAILSDLDRTFLGSGSVVVPRNVEAIEYFKSQGGLFSLATGRIHHNLDRLIPGIAALVNAPAILCNGTYLYDFTGEKVLVERHMEPQKAYDAMAFVRQHFPNVYSRVSRREGYLVDCENHVTIDELRSYGIDTYEAIPFDEWDANGWYKIVVSGPAETLNEVQIALEMQFPDTFEYNRSRAITLEMQMKGTNKASLLGAFRACYPDRQLTVYACGDYENDRALLAAADVAVCPSNALESIKNRCDFCLCSNDEGVIADLIDQLDKKE